MQLDKFSLSHIVNMDQTPPTVKYLSGRTNALKGYKTVWERVIESG